MSRLRPLRILFFALIGRPRCDSCGDRRATTVRVLGALAWLVCADCASWIDSDPPLYDLLEESR